MRFIEIVNKKMVLFLVIIVGIIIFFTLDIKRNNTTHKIVKLAKESQKLDKMIVKLTRFELTNRVKNIHKIILNDCNNNLWLFKDYNSSIPVNNSIAVYHLACLFGINISPIYEIVLPINGKMTYGSIQIFIDDTEIVSNKVPWELSKKQIEFFQMHQILDYFVCNPDVGGDNYLIKLKRGESFLLDIKKGDIVGVDKDDSFYETLNTPAAIWKDNYPYYSRIWDAYVEKKIDVNFICSFQLIDYIQSIDGKKMEQLLIPFFYNRELILKSVIYNRKKLKDTFKKFYGGLADKRGKDIRFQINIKDKNEYTRLVLKKIKKIVFKKKEWIEYLQSKPYKNQENINVVFCREGFNKVRSLEYISRKNMFAAARKVLSELETLRKNVPGFCEKFAIVLYIREVDDILRERELECFFRKPTENIVISPNDIDVCSWEHSLRTFYKLSRQIPDKNFLKFDFKSQNILKHLSFIQWPINQGEKKIIFSKYKKQISNNSLVRFIKGMLFNEIECLEEVEDNCGWKYLGKGMLFWLYEDWNKAMQEYQKAIAVTNDRTVKFLGYRLLGFIYEHNEKRVRFGEGFDVENAIVNYEKAIKIEPASVEVLLNLASLYLIKELPEKSLLTFVKIKKLIPQYAKEYFHLENIKEKIEYKKEREYLEAIKVNTLSGENHYAMGLSYAVKKQNELAKKHFNQAKKFGYNVNCHLE